MQDEQAFLQAMQDHPEDNALRLVFADWLEERDDARGELIRLLHTLTQSIDVPDRNKLEDRLRSLVAAGVQPVGPYWTNSIGMTFAWIPAGTFLMGSPSHEAGRLAGEIPHTVRLSKGFYLAIHPVSQAAWREIMGNNPSRTKGKKRPVEQVSWNDCQEFLQQLTNRDGQAYRLPTEAEWEYACRAGTTTPFSFGETIADHANWVDPRSDPKRRKTTVVGSFPPNAWGLHDMHGNVWEWCADWYGDYPQGQVIDPQGPQDGQDRVMRGGSFGSGVMTLRSAVRRGSVPTSRYAVVGFRAARIVSA